ncbi:unnamed protein product, partial [marine sediment metagenome]
MWNRIYSYPFINTHPKFNNFGIPDESLRNQVEWLFIRGREGFYADTYTNSSPNEYYMDRYSSKDGIRVCWEFKKNELTRIIWGQAKKSKYPYYLWHGQCQAYFMEENAKLLYAEIYLNENERDCSKQFIKIRYITENGDRFEGHGTNCTKSV